MKRLTGRRPVTLLTLLFGLVAVAAAGRHWASGTTSDAVLGTTVVRAVGSDLATGYVALILVVVAAVIAAVVTGPRVRVVALILGALAALGAVAQAALLLRDPAAALGPVAAAAVGRTGSIPVSATTSSWAWVGLGAAVGLVVAVFLGLVGVRAWPRPSGRYDAPGAAPDEEAGSTTGPRGQRVGSDWERLTAGEDPTDVPEPEQT